MKFMEILLQCPCSGNGNSVVSLVIIAALWLLFIWIKNLSKSKGVSFVNKATKIVIVIALIAIVGIVFAVKQKNKTSVYPVTAISSNSEATTDSKSQNLETPNSVETAANLPRLVDLGAGKCVPCKMMKPILDGLREEYKGRFEVIFIDVWEKPDEAKKYGINLIPTQIFYDASGKELFRHEGFFAKEDILAKWEKLGFEFKKKD